MRTFPIALPLLMLVLGAAAAPALEISPVALPDPETPWQESYLQQQVLALEATIKSRRAEKAMGAAFTATVGMGHYDVTWYDLALDLDPATTTLTGTTTVRAQVTAATLAEVDLHLNPNMTVTSARSAGQPVAYVRVDDILTVTLDRVYGQDETFDVEVDYFGNPDGGAFGWLNWRAVPPNTLIWTLSEPWGARDWWVCKDLNSDKADSVDLHITVPDTLIAVSNGTLVAETVPAPGRRTFHWEERYPIASYLVSLTAYPYVVLNDVYQPLVGDPMPIVHYVLPERAAQAQDGYAVTAPMLATFAAGFGEYPFVDERYGHAHFPWGGGMEHQTCSSMLYWYYGEWIIAHEMAHQWWGDLITCADFHHIWLNEGFARWSEVYWFEMSQGAQAARDHLESIRYLGPGTVYVENPETDDIFDGDLSYNKGGWVVHMLRHTVGDAAFFAGLQEYRAQYGYASATTEQLQAVMEAASGRDLAAFFQQWIYEEGHPVYETTWTETPPDAGVAAEVTVRVSQVQPGILFAMPLEIAVATYTETVVHRVENALADEWYTFPVDGIPVSVTVDPDAKVLCEHFGIGGISAVPAPSATVSRSRIHSNAPNPFNPATTVAYELGRGGGVRLEIFDAAGRLVRALLDGQRREAGPQRETWDGRDGSGRTVAAGVYFVRLRAPDGESLHKMTLVK